MLFGMMGAPATFHRNMTMMMEPVMGEVSRIRQLVFRRYYSRYKER